MKKIRNLLFISVIIFTVLNINSCKEKKAEEKEVIKIGVILPLTGSAAIWGKNALNGINLALEVMKGELNSKNYDLKIVIEDSKSETKNAVGAFEKLVTNDNVPIVIGDIASSSFLAMAPYANKNKVVILSPGASNPDISHSGDYVFRNWQSDALEGSVDAEFIFQNLKKEKVAILNVNNAYGTGLANAFSTKFIELGGKIIIRETFEQDSYDMRIQLIKIKKTKPEIIYMPGYPNEMAIVLKQSKELRIGIPFLSTQAFDDPTIINNAAAAANGTIFSIPAPTDTTNKIVNEFEKGYKRKFGIDAGVCSNTGYDAIRIIVKGIDAGARIGSDFRKFLNSLKDFEGAAGKTTFDSNGDVHREFVFKILKNSQKETYN